MPCNPNDVSIDIPSGPSGPKIPGFGSPFSLKLPNINPFPEDFPEDLLDLLNKLEMLIPPGALKPQMSMNNGKTIFDAIMKVIDQFLPFLMLYKFFLPILKLLLCIIEVLCAIKNPFKLVKAINRLFRNCLPDFLNLFPIFALIMMIIALLLLLLALIEYIINQIIKFIKAIIRNIINLNNAINRADDVSILAIAKKLGSLLCIFQNLFVLFAIFNIIIQIFRDILSLVFAIPPCDDTDPTDENGCCTPDVCPAIVKTQYTRTTGQLQYFNQVSFVTTLPFPLDPSGMFTIDIRSEDWQLYDNNQEIFQAFSNIYDGYDVPISPKPVFFPTDVTFSSTTPPKQAAYTLDLRLFYNPANWGRIGTARWIRFTDCIMLTVPSPFLSNYNNTTLPIANGVVKLVGGLGYEDDGYTFLIGFGDDGVTPLTDQATYHATLENFLHKVRTPVTAAPAALINDGYLFNNAEYTFKPNLPILVSKDLITLGCDPDVSANRVFINTVLVGDANVRLQALNDLINSGAFPNPAQTQECLSTALAGLRGNLTLDGAATFQKTALTCLQQLADSTNNAIGNLVGLGFDPSTSSFTLDPPIQFTGQPITVTVNLNEKYGTSLTKGLTPEIAPNIASRIKAFIGFGNIDNFTYDGYQLFTAQLNSLDPGGADLSVSFDGQVFCTNTIPADTNIAATHTLQQQAYQFIFAPTVAGISVVPTAEGDETTEPRRDEGDVSRDGGGV